MHLTFMLKILVTFFTRRRLIITELSPSVSVPGCTCLVSLGLKTNVYVCYCSTQGTKVSVEVSSIFVSLNEPQKSTPKVHLHWQSLNHNCQAKNARSSGIDIYDMHLPWLLGHFDNKQAYFFCCNVQWSQASTTVRRSLYCPAYCRHWQHLPWFLGCYNTNSSPICYCNAQRAKVSTSYRYLCRLCRHFCQAIMVSVWQFMRHNVAAVNRA